MHNEDELEPRYYIDLNWYKQNNRSFFTLVQGYLCPTCQDKLAKEGSSEIDLLEATRDCCSRMPGFITPKLPILETLFRILLANGNQPLTTKEIDQQIRNLRAESFSPTPEVLRHLLDHDQYYGLSRVPLEPEESPEEEEKDSEE